MWTWFGQDDPYMVMVPHIELSAPSEVGGGAEANSDQAKILVFGDSFLHSMVSTAHIVADHSSSFVLKQGDKFSYSLPDDAGKDSWLIAVIGRQRNPEIINTLKPNLVMFEVVERDIPFIADLLVAETKKDPLE